MALGALDNIIKQALGQAVEAAAHNAELAARVSDALGDDFVIALRRGDADEYLENLRNSDTVDDETKALLNSSDLGAVVQAFNRRRTFLDDLDALAANPDAVDADAIAKLYADHGIEAGDSLDTLTQRTIHEAREAAAAPAGGGGATPPPGPKSCACIARA